MTGLSALLHGNNMSRTSSGKVTTEKLPRSSSELDMGRARQYTRILPLQRAHQIKHKSHIRAKSSATHFMSSIMLKYRFRRICSSLYLPVQTEAVKPGNETYRHTHSLSSSVTRAPAASSSTLSRLASSAVARSASSSLFSSPIEPTTVTNRCSIRATAPALRTQLLFQLVSLRGNDSEVITQLGRLRRGFCKLLRDGIQLFLGLNPMWVKKLTLTLAQRPSPPYRHPPAPSSTSSRASASSSPQPPGRPSPTAHRRHLQWIMCRVVQLAHRSFISERPHLLHRHRALTWPLPVAALACGPWPASP
jgi:hypothetical protein